jgi:hypothetical protein
VNKTIVRWGLAVVITLVSAAWQRMSGPTYPVRGAVTVGGSSVAITLDRTHSTSSDQPVVVRVAEPTVTGELAWRHFPSAESWRVMALQRQGDLLSAALPRQAPAGKLEYQVRLQRGGEKAVFPARPAVTRFKGDVPAAVLVPHILAMFVGMLLSTAAGLAAIALNGDQRRLAWLALLLILVGGFLLGPAVQKYAFGEWWAGVPYGWDLTDNKTLLAAIAWGFALWRLRGGRPARGAVIVAAVVTLAVFAIPHSAWGSEIDWSKVPTTSPAR